MKPRQISRCDIVAKSTGSRQSMEKFDKPPPGERNVIDTGKDISHRKKKKKVRPAKVEGDEPAKQHGKKLIYFALAVNKTIEMKRLERSSRRTLEFTTQYLEILCQFLRGTRWKSARSCSRQVV